MYFNAAAISEEKVVCDPMPKLMDFDATRYLGRWYGNVHSKNQPYITVADEDSICITADYYNLDATTGIFDVTNGGQDGSKEGNPNSEIQFRGKCPAEEGVPNWCSVSFSPEIPFAEANYEVLETDYDSYALVYDCRESENFLYFYILSRTPEMDADLKAELVEKAKAALPNYNFDNMHDVVHDERCNYAEPKLATF